MKRLGLGLLARLPRRRFFIADEVDTPGDVPERLPRKAMVLVRQPSRPMWLAFDCPCERGHRLLVNLDSRRKPCWKLYDKSRRVSLSPSVDYRGPAYRCHFLIRDGRVRWFGSQRGDK
jgi:hypothetical protein